MSSSVKTLTLVLLAAALSACPAPVTPPIELPPPPEVKSFSASPVQVAVGEKATLTWSVVNTRAVTLTQIDKGPIAIDSSLAEGSVEVTLDADAVFVLTARGAGGSDQAIAAVGINAPPSALLFAAVPAEVSAGQSATLVWSAPGAAVVSISAAGAMLDLKGQRESGSLVVTPARDTVYELDADGKKATASVTVQPAIFSFGASAGSAQPGGAVTLGWQTGGATRLTLTREGAAAPLLIETDAAKIASGMFTDQVPASLPSEAVLNYQLTIERNGESVSRAAVVYVGVNPAIVNFQVPAYARQPGVFVVSWQTANADRVRIAFDGLVVYDAPSQALVDLGNAILPTPSAVTTVELRVTNVRGGVTTQQKQVAPVGEPSVIEFKADKQPGIAAGGEAVTLSWKVTNARRIKISIPGKYVITDQVGLLDNGSVVVYPNHASTVYELIADNQVGETTAPRIVTVTVGTPATFTVSSNSAPRGALIQVTGHNVPAGSTTVTGLPTVEKNAAGAAFIDIRTTGTDIALTGTDTSTKLVTLAAPFSTVVYGVPITASKISVSINGWMVFSDTTVSGTDAPSATNPPLPSGALAPLAIAPYWEDLYNIAANPLCKIYVQVDTVGQDQRLIMQWNEVEHDDFIGSKMTFQAQIFSTGKIVFAYQTLQGLTGADEPSLGIVSSDELDAVTISTRPAEGDTYTFFGDTTLPATVQVTNRPLTGFVMIPPSGQIELTNNVRLPAGEFWISELNYNPVAGNDEWFEITNGTAAAVDLKGWTIDFGAGSTHTISSTLLLPANGRLLLGQTADAAEESAGGVAVDYVYGTAASMPNAAGTLGLGFGGAGYAEGSWTAAGTAGVALRVDRPRTDLVYATGVTELTCLATASYGASGQLGTPKAASPACFPWMKGVATGTFESILFTGTPVGTMVADGILNSSHAVVVPLDFTATGGRPVSIAGQLFGDATNQLYVASDGYLSLLPITTSTPTNPTTPTTASPNAVAAIYWDDLSANTAASGVYWQQFDPDMSAGTGDEYTLISYENWRHYSSSATNLSSLNFQIKLHEGSGDLEYLFGTMTATTVSYANGSSGTTWLETADGKAALKINANSSTAPGIQPNTAFRFVYTP